MAKTGKRSAARRSSRSSRAAVPARRVPTKKAVVRRRTPAKARPASTRTPKRTVRTKTAPGALFAPVTGAERRDIGHVQLEVGRAGAARVKRMIYPVGFRWSVDMRPAIGGDFCMHAHVGFLAHGEIHIEYADGCIVEHKAPQIVAIEPGHDGWVVGTEPAVMIEFDFEGNTVERLGMPRSHAH